MKLLYFIPTVLLFGGSMVAAHQPMDTSNSFMERDIQSNSIAASVGAIDNGFSPHANRPRSIFQKRQQVCNSASDNICSQSGGLIYCCPTDYTCFYSDGWRCDPIILGLTRGQKIGIGIGVIVAFFALCIIAFVIFFCCCRKVVQVATEAVSGHNSNNNQGVYPPQQPVMYGPTGQGYDPAAAPLTQEGKLYSDNTGYYPPPPQQSGYEQYGQQQYPPPPGPPNPYPPTTAPPPPFQQPPPPQGGYH